MATAIARDSVNTGLGWCTDLVLGESSLYRAPLPGRGVDREGCGNVSAVVLTELAIPDETRQATIALPMQVPAAAPRGKLWRRSLRGCRAYYASRALIAGARNRR